MTKGWGWSKSSPSKVSVLWTHSHIIQSFYAHSDIISSNETAHVPRFLSALYVGMMLEWWQNENSLRKFGTGACSIYIYNETAPVPRFFSEFPFYIIPTSLQVISPNETVPVPRFLSALYVGMMLEWWQNENSLRKLGTGACSIYIYNETAPVPRFFSEIPFYVIPTSLQVISSNETAHVLSFLSECSFLYHSKSLILMRQHMFQVFWVNAHSYIIQSHLS